MWQTSRVADQPYGRPTVRVRESWGWRITAAWGLSASRLYTVYIMARLAVVDKFSKRSCVISAFGQAWWPQRSIGRLCHRAQIALTFQWGCCIFQLLRFHLLCFESFSTSFTIFFFTIFFQTLFFWSFSTFWLFKQFA